MSGPDDPLADLLGSMESGAPDRGENHDTYLGAEHRKTHDPDDGRTAFLSRLEALTLDWLSGHLDQRELDAWRATWTPQEQEWARQWGRALE